MKRIHVVHASATLALLAVCCAGCRQSDLVGLDASPAESGGDSAVVELNSQNFAQIVLDSDQPVLVDFWAAWCGPCREMSPIIEEVAKQFDDRAVVGKLNVDEFRDIAVAHEIDALPTMVIFRNGKEVDRIVGTRARRTLEKQLGGWVNDS